MKHYINCMEFANGLFFRTVTVEMALRNAPDAEGIPYYSISTPNTSRSHYAYYGMKQTDGKTVPMFNCPWCGFRLTDDFL